MSGLYIHIPFCTDKCFYCDFYSGNQLYLLDDYVDALVAEISVRSNYLVDKEIDTIYFGGGTPSLLLKLHLVKILNIINKQFKVSDNAEITLECNPENINDSYLHDIFVSGINRISLGVQFLDDQVLRSFNRKHSKELIFNALDIIEKSEIDNLSVDLIYSVPGVSNEALLNSLIQLTNYDIKHFSAYSLTVSRNSRLFWKIKNGDVIESNENNFIEQYNIVNNYLTSKSYVQYEVSNYAKDGFLSYHNLAYWNQVPYLGVGVSAHSYDLVSRQWNHKNIKKYINDLKVGFIGFDIEQLSEIQKYNEYVILKLRTFQGLSFSFIKDNFDANVFNHFVNRVEVLKNKNHFVFQEDLIIPSHDDLLLADYLAKDLML